MGELESDTFVEKAARSVSELQPNVNNLADVMVFLEVLGYTDATARNGGLADLYDLAVKVFQRVDFYDEGSELLGSPTKAREVPVPSVRKRLLESLSLATPWLGGLALLYAFGVSLWLAWGLPLGPVTALLVGVLLGLLVSEGPLQMFTRIFMFYHAQGNVSECSRALKRSYAILTLLLGGSVAIVSLTGIALKVPWELIGLAAVGAATIAYHRIGFLPIYALKRTGVIMAAYGTALPLLVVVFETTSSFFPDAVIRYLLSLASALSVMAVYAWHYSKKSLVVQTSTLVGRDAPPFFKPIFINEKSIRSKFSVQFWEALPYYLFGTFFFVMLYSDRVLSWIGNPVKEVGGVALPLVFNSVYHAGADLALAVLFPVALVQYVLLSSIHEELNNLSLTLSVTQTGEVDRFLRRRHSISVSLTLLVSAATAVLVVTVVPGILARLGGSAVSIQVLDVAAMSDVLLAVFVANSSFMLLLNRPKALALMTMCGAAIVGGVGLVVLPFGFQYLVYGYLAGCATLAIWSSVGVSGLLASPSSLFFSKFA